MTKLEQIKKKYKISYKEIEMAVPHAGWNTGISVSNLNKIFKENVGCELISLFKIISGINTILRERGFTERITPNDCVDYEDYLHIEPDFSKQTELLKFMRDNMIESELLEKGKVTNKSINSIIEEYNSK